MKKPDEPRQTNPHESAMFAAELGAAPEIDLHGETVESALARVDAFLDHEFFAGTEAVKIVHGLPAGRQAGRGGVTAVATAVTAARCVRQFAIISKNTRHPSRPSAMRTHPANSAE